jgi:putative transposase
MPWQGHDRISERRACEVLSLNRSTCRYRHRRDGVDRAHRAVVRLSAQYDYWGYRKIHDLLHQAQVAVSRERLRLIAGKAYRCSASG